MFVIEMRAILLTLVLSLGLVGVNQVYADSSDSGDNDDFPGLDKLRERGGNPADFPCERNPNCNDEAVGGGGVRAETAIRNIVDGLDPDY